MRTARRTKIIIAITVFSALAACKTSSKPAGQHQLPGSSAAVSSAAAARRAGVLGGTLGGRARLAPWRLPKPPRSSAQAATRSAISPVPALPTTTPSTDTFRRPDAKPDAKPDRQGQPLAVRSDDLSRPASGFTEATRRDPGAESNGDHRRP